MRFLTCFFQDRAKTGPEICVQMLVAFVLVIPMLGLPYTTWYRYNEWQYLERCEAATSFEVREFPEIAAEKVVTHQVMVRQAKTTATIYLAATILCAILLVWQIENSTRPGHGNAVRLYTYLFGEDRRNWPFRDKFANVP